MNAATIRHVENALLVYDYKASLSSFLHAYFRNYERTLTRKDQYYVEDTVHDLIKWRRVLDHLCVSPTLRSSE